MEQQLTKVNDYTLLETTKIEGTEGVLCRSFNFASKQLITVFREVTTIQDDKSDRISDSGPYGAKGSVSVSTSVSTAITSKMDIQKFSDLQSDQEIKLMAKELQKQGGKPLGYEGMQQC